METLIKIKAPKLKAKPVTEAVTYLQRAPARDRSTQRTWATAR
jgi:hypothetical protein